MTLTRNYEKTTFIEASRQFIGQSATCIQKAVRGLLSRLAFFDRLSVEKRELKSKQLREKLVAHKLARISSKLSGFMQRKTKAIQAAVGQADVMLKRHEELMAGYQKNCEALLRKRCEIQRDIFERLIEDKIKTEDLSVMQGPSTWTTAFNLAKGRLGEDCSICLGELKGNRPLMATSCGHLFHAACLLAFEQFATEKKGSCPNCRHHYNKAPFMKSD